MKNELSKMYDHLSGEKVYTWRTEDESNKVALKMIDPRVSLSFSMAPSDLVGEPLYTW